MVSRVADIQRVGGHQASLEPRSGGLSQLLGRGDGEHLDVKQLTDYIQDELINSGKVWFVNKAQRQKLLEEIKYQQSGNMEGKTAKKGGRQLRADYVLSGNVTSSVHQMDEVKAVTYQTNLTLTTIENFELECRVEYKINKRYQRSAAKWH